MKSLRLILLMAVTMLTIGASAKIEKSDQMYMYGFSASFKDSVIYVTDIQNVRGAYIDTKTKFLVERDEYSRQLKDYLADKQQQPGRVCMVFFYTKKSKAEKQFLKLMKKYQKGYEVRHLNATEFKFEAIDMSSGEQ